MIRAGKEIAVVDAASGEDLTSVTLAQIILENERNHRATLPHRVPAPAHQAR
jgi:polyhydroxyalkanoate synthesis regulator protein